MEKKRRARGIIVKDGKLIVMYREFEDRSFYCFPGGGMEGDEREEECVAREVKEEFGINVNVKRKLYDYENANNIETFYLCEWTNGVFGSGDGEEYDEGNTKGLYKPTFIEISDIPSLPLMPAEIATSFYQDYINKRI